MNSVTDAPLYSPAPDWTGRDDGPGKEHARWHNTVEPLEFVMDKPAGVVLVGFASDEGVARNGGRQGAARGPQAIRNALGGLAVHDDFPRYDAGTITTQGTDLEGAHQGLAKAVAGSNANNHLVIVLGGGHETAFGSHSGAYRAHGEPLAIVNLDAHFDLRQADQPTSGTPFKQIADLVHQNHSGKDAFDYTVLGISKPNNTAVLFNTADELAVTTVLDTELAELSPQQAAELAVKATAHKDAVHLSIDLDVLPADQAPGVSAPASLGVPFSHIRAMAVAIAATGKLKLVDVVELNPEFDIDNRTAKLAARLIDDIVTAHAQARASH